MSDIDINIYALKQVHVKRRRYHELEDCHITSSLACYKVIQYTLNLKSEPCGIELQYATLKKRASALFKFGIITLNAKHKLAGIHIIGTSTIDRVYIEPRDNVFLISFNRTG